MKKRPLAQRLALVMALLTLFGPATFVAARPGGSRGGGDRGGTKQGAVTGIVASVDARTSSFVLQLEGKKRGRRGSQSLDITVNTNAKTNFSLGDRRQGSFEDVSVGARALVKGTRNGDGSFLAQLVALKSPRPPKEASVKGLIDALDPNTASFLLATRARGREGKERDLLVHTSNATLFLREDGAEASFADLAEGDAVEARGTLNADGSFQAAAVEIHVEDDEPHPFKLIGVIDGIDAANSSFSLRPGAGRAADDPRGPSFLILTDANTAFTKADVTAGRFADLAVGAKAAVAGVRGEEGVLAASVHLAAPEPPHEVALRGTVASMDATAQSFVVKPGEVHPGLRENGAGILIRTSDATSFQKPDGSAAKFADLVVGGQVAVKGTANEDRAIDASLVLIAGEAPPHETGLRGTVTSVDAASKSFVLKPGDAREAGMVEHPGVTIQTGEGTVFQKADGSVATLADVTVGGRVAVKGTVSSERSIDAKVVVIGADEPPHEIALRGTVTSVDAASKTFVLKPGVDRADGPVEHPGVTIHTGEDTAFQKADGSAATFADVVTGARVGVKGTVGQDRVINAKLVVIGGEETIFARKS